jgi:hypothetical protein
MFLTGTRSLISNRLTIAKATRVFLLACFDEVETDSWSEWKFELDETRWFEAVLRVALLHNSPFFMENSTWARTTPRVVCAIFAAFLSDVLGASG